MASVAAGGGASAAYATPPATSVASAAALSFGRSRTARTIMNVASARNSTPENGQPSARCGRSRAGSRQRSTNAASTAAAAFRVSVKPT